jgi:hypothetical protein
MTTLTAIITALGLLFLFVIGILLGKFLSKNTIKNVYNAERKFGSNPKYILIKGNYEGSKIDLLFTENDIKDAKERAFKNQEDLK